MGFCSASAIFVHSFFKVKCRMLLNVLYVEELGHLWPQPFPSASFWMHPLLGIYFTARFFSMCMHWYTLEICSYGFQLCPMHYCHVQPVICAHSQAILNSWARLSDPAIRTWRWPSCQYCCGVRPVIRSVRDSPRFSMLSWASVWTAMGQCVILMEWMWILHMLKLKQSPANHHPDTWYSRTLQMWEW